MGFAACCFSLCFSFILLAVFNEAVSIRSAKSSNKTVGNVATVEKTKKILPVKGQPIIRKKLKAKKRETGKAAKSGYKPRRYPKVRKKAGKRLVEARKIRRKSAIVGQKKQIAQSQKIEKPKLKKIRKSATFRKDSPRLKKKTRRSLMPNDQPVIEQNKPKVIPRKTEKYKKESIRIIENPKQENNIVEKNRKTPPTKEELFMKYAPNEYAAYLNCMEYKEPTINKTYIELHPGHIYRGITDCRDESNALAEVMLYHMPGTEDMKRVMWDENQSYNYERFGEPTKCKQWRYGSDCRKAFLIG